MAFVAEFQSAGEELVRIRTKLGLTIREFARRLAVPEARYKNWEYGRSQ